MFEVNLVPDVKAEMVKAQRIRNIVLFFCLILVGACVTVVMVLGGIKAGQDITMSNQDGLIDSMSKKIHSFSDLDELLTMQTQLNSLGELSQEKKLLSRIFSIIGVFLPTNGDEITLSELNVNLEENTISFDAQADSKTAPYIDYNVLEAFKKSMGMMRYDYGKFVDEDGNEIPDVCVRQTDVEGNAYSENGMLYGIWTRGVKGCDPEALDDEEKVQIKAEDVLAAVNNATSVKVWRTPQFNNWYEAGYMSEGGEISGVPHFESECISYSYGAAQRWTSENVCNLVDGDITISGSSNAKGVDGELVLRFSAVIKLMEEAFLAKNTNMIAIAPDGYTNVTDSYVQIESMFKEGAAVCGEDVAC